MERVWEFYTDVKHLEIITPKETDLKIINFTSQNIVQGQEIWCSGKIITKIRRTVWHSKITFLKPYEYIDEIVDEIEFELPYGIFGKLFLEGYACKQLHKIFEYRKIATIRALK